MAPTLVRSQALAALYEAARRGEITAAEGIECVTRLNSLKVRFVECLADLVHRAEHD